MTKSWLLGTFLVPNILDKTDMIPEMISLRLTTLTSVSRPNGSLFTRIWQHLKISASETSLLKTSIEEQCERSCFYHNRQHVIEPVLHFLYVELNCDSHGTELKNKTGINLLLIIKMLRKRSRHLNGEDLVNLGTDTRTALGQNGWVIASLMMQLWGSKIPNPRR